MTEREFEAPGVEEPVLAIAAQLNRREMAYFRIDSECPADVRFIPRKRISRSAKAISAFCQKQAHAPQQSMSVLTEVLPIFASS